MNEWVERILFCLVCIQIGMIYTNHLEIVPGITLGTGEVNNAWGGSLTNPTDASNELSDSFTKFVSAIDFIGTIDSSEIEVLPKSFYGEWVIFGGWIIKGNQAIFVHNLEHYALAGGQLLGVVLAIGKTFISIFYLITIGSIGFYTNIFSLLSKDNAALYGVPIAMLQILLVSYYIGKTVLEILGAKSKSVATNGAAGQ